MNHTFIFTPRHGCKKEGGSLSASVGVPSCVWGALGGKHSQTYSLVLLGGPERGGAMDGYLDTCFFRGQEAASMAPPRTSSREPPHAMKMAAPNSNLGNTTLYWVVFFQKDTFKGSIWKMWFLQFSKDTISISSVQLMIKCTQAFYLKRGYCWRAATVDRIIEYGMQLNAIMPCQSSTSREL